MKTAKLDKKTIANIAKVTSLIGKSTILPILENAKLENHELLFSNLQNSVILKNIPIEGRTCIPSQQLNNVLKLFPEFTTKLSEDQITFVSADGSERLKVSTEDADDFPRVPVTSESVITLVGTLTDADVARLKIAIQFVGADDLRPAMTNVAITQGYIAATDAHSLYWEPSDLKHEAPILLSVKALKLIQLFHATEDPLTVSLTGDFNSMIILENSQSIIYTRNMDERYPDFLAVIPKENPNGFIIAKATLAGPLAKAISQANKTTNQVRFKLTSGNLSISSENVDFSTEYSKDFGTKAEIQLLTAGELEIGFNGKFLERILANCGDVISLKCSVPSRGAIINDHFLLMPVLLNDHFLLIPVLLNAYA